jgi:hypothetical protein
LVAKNGAMNPRLEKFPSGKRSEERGRFYAVPARDRRRSTAQNKFDMTLELKDQRGRKLHAVVERLLVGCRFRALRRLKVFPL